MSLIGKGSTGFQECFTGNWVGNCCPITSLLYSTRLEVFGQLKFVPQVAHDRDTYTTLNISP